VEQPLIPAFAFENQLAGKKQRLRKFGGDLEAQVGRRVIVLP